MTVDLHPHSGPGLCCVKPQHSARGLVISQSLALPNGAKHDEFSKNETRLYCIKTAALSKNKLE